MGNVSLPTPVALTGAAICLLGGYLVGVLAGPDTTSRTTATVISYDAGSGELCLTGDGVKDQEGAGDGDTLCGRWRRAGESSAPQKGDRFRFVTLSGGATGDGAGESPAVVIYGDVVR